MVSWCFARASSLHHAFVAAKARAAASAAGSSALLPPSESRSSSKPSSSSDSPPPAKSGGPSSTASPMTSAKQMVVVGGSASIGGPSGRSGALPRNSTALTCSNHRVPKSRAAASVRRRWQWVDGLSGWTAGRAGELARRWDGCGGGAAAVAQVTNRRGQSRGRAGSA